MKKKLRNFLPIFLILQGAPAFAGTPPATFKYLATEFNSQMMSPLQQSLMKAYFLKTDTTYESWISDEPTGSNNDGKIAAFLGVTRALSYLEIRLQDGRWITADKMLLAINQFEGDRVKTELDSALFDSWRDAGADFILHRASGKTEQGQFHFDQGDLGGSLHPGSDVQGYTSYVEVPRIQINYNNSTHEADIDLDGYAPWIGGFIPNPHHMTWENSDIRYWFDEYQESFGNPGFQVVKNNTP